MSYQGGQLGCFGASSTVFMMLMGRIFLTSLSVIIGSMRQACWLGVFIQGIVELLVCLALINAMFKDKGDFFAWLENVVGIYLAKIIILFYMLTFFTNTVGLLRQYAENTVTTSMPDLDFTLAVIWFCIACGILCAYGFECIGRACSIILPIVICGLILIFVLIHPFYISYHLIPWQGIGLANIIKEGILGAGYNFGAMLLIILAPALQTKENTQKSLYLGLFGAVFFKMLYVIIYLLVFGSRVGQEKTMPFFELTRLVYINRYIQHIESLMILIWVIFGLVAISINLYVAIYLCAKLLHLPAISPIIPIFVVILGDLATIPENISEIMNLETIFIKYIALIAGVILPIILLLVWYLKKLMWPKAWIKA